MSRLNLFVAPWCVCRSVYYAAKRRKKTLDVPRILLRSQVRELFQASRGSAGSRTLMRQLQALGHQVSRYQVRRLMAEANLVSSEPAHRYKKKGQARVDIPSLLERQFPVVQPNQVWCGDMTYVWAEDRWHYLAVVLDLHTRRAVGFALLDKPNAALVTTAFENAVRERRPAPGLLFHSDQGSQYVSRRFRRLLWRHRVKQSMSRRGNCWDNAPMERLFRSVKTEWLPPLGYETLAVAREDPGRYLLGHYNWERPHQANGGLAPARAEQQLKMVSGFY